MGHRDLQFLQSELSRVSEWVRFADGKAGFLAVFYIAIFGFIASKKDEVTSLMFSPSCFYSVLPLLYIGLFLTVLVGVYYLFATVFPRLKNTCSGRSLFYFGSIAEMKADDYSQDCERATNEDAQKQITEQIHANSVIAAAKMKNLQLSTKWLIVAGLLTFVISFF